MAGGAYSHFGVPPANGKSARRSKNGPPRRKTDLTYERDQRPELGDPVVRGEVLVRVVDRGDADHVGLAHFVEKRGDDLVEMVLAHFDAVRAAESLDAEFDAFLGGDLQRRQRFLDEHFGWLVMHRDGEVFVLLGGGG